MTVFKILADTYTEVLKAIRIEGKRLSSLGADEKSIQRTRTGEMMLKKEATKKGTSYKALAQKVLGEEVQVRALKAKATFQG